MNTRLLSTTAFLTLLLVAPPVACVGADVLQNVPHDALGFVVVKNLAATDAKADQLLKTLHAEYPSPLAFLKAVTGISEGLDPQGDFLLAVLPGAADAKLPPQFGVWLPVADYDRMLAALDAAPRDGISVVRVADEDLLIARHGGWALVMDPDQRERMEKLLAAEPNPPAAIAAWKSWIEANDVAAVALPDGIRATLAWAAATPIGPDENPGPAEETTDDIFGQANEADDPFAAAADDQQPTDRVYGPVRSALQEWVVNSPRLNKWVMQAEAIGCAARVDDNGNALAGLRISCSNEQLADPRGNVDKKLTSTLYQGGNFVLNGAGHLPPALMEAAAEIFARLVANDLKTQQRLVIEDATFARFQQSLQSAFSDVTSAAVLTQPGDKSEGLYTNDYLVVRVASADSFVDHAGEVMRLWNTVNRDAEGETPLIFDVEEQKIGNREATQYSLDIAGAEGLALPEIRQAMEKFFGPGGKLRLWIVPVDDKTVLLAAATPPEITAAIEVLDKKQPFNWSHFQPGATNNLLPAQTDWRLFFGIDTYHSWQQHLLAVMTGPVFGGRPKRQFPQSPPVGAAGSFRNNELSLDVAIPVDTIKSAGEYRKK